MKWGFLFLCLLLPGLAKAEVIFTTIFYEDTGKVYVGLKRINEGENESRLVLIPFPESGPSRTYLLPEEIRHRDIIGVLPSHDNTFILTNDPEEEKRTIQLHLMTKDIKWRKIGSIDCATFTKVRLATRSVSFSCERQNAKPNKRGNIPIQVKTISTGKIPLYRTGVIRLPEFLLRYKGISIVLEGKAPKWDKIRLKTDTHQRLMPAEELFHE